MTPFFSDKLGCLDYILQISSDLKKKKAKCKQYPRETITAVDCVSDLALVTNTPAQAESLLHSLEQAARCIGLSVNPDKTELMGFKQDDAISTLNDKPLKLGDTFTYLNSNITSERDVNIWIKKVRTESLIKLNRNSTKLWPSQYYYIVAWLRR